MTKQNHIVILTPGFPKNETDTLCIPALQVYLQNYRKLFPNDIFSVIAFEYPYFSGAYSWHGINIYSCGGGNSRIKRPLTLWRATSFLKTIHKNLPVTFLHSFWFSECSAIGHRFSQSNNIPHLITLMGQDVLETNSYLKKSELFTDPIIALSNNHAKTFYATTGKIPNAIIPWGLDKSECDFSYKHRAPYEFDYHILGVGSLTSLKNYELFIDCVYELKSELPDIKAAIIGSGPKEQELQSKINQLDLKRNITLLGEKSRPEVLSIMTRSKILLHPSKYESFGYVFSEALASGAAVVSFDVGWATPSNQWRVSNDKKEMIKNLRELLQANAPIFNSLIPNTIEDTAKAYNAWYCKR